MTDQAIRPSKITVFFDGSCPLCVREIGLLKRSVKPGIIDWLDISPGQNCAADTCEVSPGLTQIDAMKLFHIRNEKGALVSGAEAFLTIWQHHHRFGSIAKLINREPFIMVLNGVYRLFLLLRPSLQWIARRALPEPVDKL